ESFQPSLAVATKGHDLVREESDDDLAVRGRHEGPAFLAEFLPDLVRVRDIPVVRERDVPVRGLDDDRLGVLEDARSRRGITNVADPVVPAEVHEVLLREDLVHEAHAPFGLHLAVVHRAARGILAAGLGDRLAGVGAGSALSRTEYADVL